MTRFLQSALVTIFFLTMMFFLFRDHVIPEWSRGEGIEIDQRVLSDSWVNQDDYYEIKLGGLKLGSMHVIAEEEAPEGDGYIVGMNAQITTFLRARITSIARMNRRLEMEYARVRLNLAGAGQEPLSAEELSEGDLPPGVWEVAAHIESRTLRIRLRRDDAVQYRELPLERSVTMSDSVAPVLKGNMLTKGKVYTLDIYEPITGGRGEVQVTYVDDKFEMIDDEPMFLRKVLMKLHNVTNVLWVDNLGYVWRREIPLVMPGGSGGATTDSAATLVMQRLEPSVALPKYPELFYIPEVPAYDADEFTGESSGEIFGGLSAFGMLTQSLMERMD